MDVVDLVYLRDLTWGQIFRSLKPYLQIMLNLS